MIHRVRRRLFNSCSIGLALLIGLSLKLSVGLSAQPTIESIEFDFQVMSLSQSFRGVSYTGDPEGRFLTIPNGNFSTWCRTVLLPEQNRLGFYGRAESSVEGQESVRPLLFSLPITAAMNGGLYRVLIVGNRDNPRAIPVDFTGVVSEPGQVYFVNSSKKPIALEMGYSRMLLQPNEQKIQKVDVNEDGLLPTLILQHEGEGFKPVYRNNFALSSNSQGIFLIFDAPGKPGVLNTRLIYARAKKNETKSTNENL